MEDRFVFQRKLRAFLYYDKYQTSNAVDLLGRIVGCSTRSAYRKIEKFLHRKTMRFMSIWQWLWNHYTAKLKECFILIDWTKWGDGQQVLMASLAHKRRCLPFLAIAYNIRKIVRSQNQAEHSFFLLLRLLKQSGQIITCIKDRGFSRISLLKLLKKWKLHFITRVCQNAYFENSRYRGLLKNFKISQSKLYDLGVCMLGKSIKNQTLVRLVIYFGDGHKQPWILATDRLDLTAKEIVALYTRRMGIDAGFRDMKGRRFGWGLKNIRIKNDVMLTILWAASMVAYCLKMAAGDYRLKRDPDAMFSWTKKGPRRSLLAVGRNAIQFGLLDIDELLSIIPNLPLRRNKLSSKELPNQSLIKRGR